jgi:hypothetical protein
LSKPSAILRTEQRQRRWSERGAVYRSQEHQSNEYAWLFNQMKHDVKAQFAGVLRTNGKHRAGYEYKQWDVSERMHKIFVSMHFLEHDSDPTMQPTFAPPVPNELSLPINGEPVGGQKTFSGKW